VSRLSLDVISTWRYPAAAPFNGEVHSWSYDAIGNRLTNTVNSTTATYTYQKLGTNPNNWQRLVSDGTNSYSYDANGNTVTRTGYTFGWDYENRMTTITGTPNATYTYDYSGRRSSKTVSGSATAYLYDGLNLVTETAGATTTYHLFGPGIDEPLASSSGASVIYHAVDGLGSLALATDAAGTVQDSYTYDAWGVGRSSTETFSQPFRYTAREVGDASNDLFYRARFLAPLAGRFLSEDPIGFGGGVNFYGYALGDPIRFKDPLGLKVYRCCARADIPGNPGFSHCWLKTETREAGLGNLDVGQPAGQAVPNNQCGGGYPFVQTQIVNHMGQSVSRAGTTCTEIPDTDEQCVNDNIWTDRRGYGATQGLWAPWHQCNSVANDILRKCKKPKCDGGPSPPGDNGRRYF